jgi:GNAT superfamily N-acetyltransferase
LSTQAEMMVIAADAASHPIEALERILREADGSPYDLMKVAAEKCQGAGYAGPASLLLAGSADDPDGLAVYCGNTIRLLLVRRESRRRGIGTMLLDEARNRMRREGHRRMRLGAEAGNYLTPGVWTEAPGLNEFAERLGFGVEADAVDLVVELAALPSVMSTRVRRAAQSDRSRVLHFIEQEFGRVWRFETDRAFENDPPSIFIAEERGEIIGFSAAEANNRGLGSYGPAGVRSDHRKSGIGRDLLLASMNDLRERGYAKAIIPWAAAIPFYERVAQAKVTHHFRTWSKEL